MSRIIPVFPQYIRDNVFNQRKKLEDSPSFKASLAGAKDRKPVFVATQEKPGQYDNLVVGTQFWTDEMIAAGWCRNTDRTISLFIEKY